MADPLNPRIFPLVLVNYAPMASVYEALAQVLPPELLNSDGRTYVDRLARDAINDGPRRMAVMADDLRRRGLFPAFINALARLEPTNAVLREVLGGRVAVEDDGRVSEAALHTIRARLEQFVDPAALEALLAARPRVCAILVEGSIKGTGFLVGPDLVMTARHVVSELLESEDGDPLRDVQRAGSAQRLACVFDYEGTLYRPFPLDPPPPGTSVIKVADDWLVWSSHRHYNDGVGHHFDSPPDIRQLFDCAVVRLSKPVGQAATDSTGSQIRGWIRFEDHIDGLTPGQRLGIWQHPGEGPRVYGDGYFRGEAAGGTRIWYSAPADSGSSGAPCFDTRCRVVAFHNAGWPTRPEAGSTTKEFNQGVPIGPLVRAMPAGVRAQLAGRAGAESRLWSLGEDGRDADGNPHPVLGRAQLRRWMRAMGEHGAARRVIVVEDAPDQRGVSGSGKSFSTRILRAMTRSRPGLVIGVDAAALEDVAPEAFLTDLGRQIGILSDELPMPICPSEERQLTRWWANDLPNWFGLMVEEGARRDGTLKPNPLPGVDVDDAVVFAPTWIVVDDLHRAKLGLSMRECLAGMIGITESAARLAPGLASLRWLLVGAVPDFVREMSTQYELDVVAQVDIGEEDWVACCKDAFEAEGLADLYEEPAARMLYEFAGAANPILEVVPRTRVADPAYLPTLARAAALAIGAMLRKARR